MRKKIIASLGGTALILCTFVGLETLSDKLNKQEPIVVETVQTENTSNVKTDGNSSQAGALAIEAKGAVLIDAESGEVLFEQDCHKELPPASVTKVMTMLLVMEAADDGRITLDDEVTISERAASMGGSQMYMEAGEKHKVRELMEGVAMASANDGCVALSEYVAGSEEIFVERMNKRAEELGMRDTHFVNTNGLPVTNHYSSAYDIAVMSKALYAHKETHQWFTKWQSTITVGLPGKEKEFGLTNTNKLIKAYPGCNGIKTGFTSDAGFCLSASAARGDTHLIAVALGCETSKIRNAQVAKLFDYGFANFEAVTVAEKGQKMAQMEVSKGTPQQLDVVTLQKITALAPKGKTESVTTRIELKDQVKLPLKKGSTVGSMIVLKDGKEIGKYKLVSDKKIEKASFKELVCRMFTYQGDKKVKESKKA